MPCGCHPLPVLDIRTRAACCRVCPHAKPVQGKPAAFCGKHGRRVAAMLPDHGASCERWPNKRGRTKANQHERTRTWRGLPEPLRWRLDWLMGRSIDLPGCGCHIPLKWALTRRPLLRPVARMLRAVPLIRRWVFRNFEGTRMGT